MRAQDEAPMSLAEVENWIERSVPEFDVGCGSFKLTLHTGGAALHDGQDEPLIPDADKHESAPQYDHRSNSHPRSHHEPSPMEGKSGSRSRSRSPGRSGRRTSPSSYHHGGQYRSTGHVMRQSRPHASAGPYSSYADPHYHRR